jgi:Trypsin-like peptidase domain
MGKPERMKFRGTSFVFSLAVFSAIASQIGFSQDRIPSIPSQSNPSPNVVGDCLAIFFVDTQQASNQAIEQVAAHAIELGWAVRRVDTRREVHVAERWRIHSSPTIVLVRGGREVDRILGQVTSTELFRRMLKFSAPDSIRDPGVTPLAGLQRPSSVEIDIDAMVPMQQRPSRVSPPAGVDSVSGERASSDPYAATVRIIVDEPDSHAVGSGTIIESSSQGAVVLTCGHLFRDRTAQSVIVVERFEGETVLRYAAELVDYQIDDVDIGVLVFQPGKVVPSARVTGQLDSVRQGDVVYSMGCDHGSAPSRFDSRVTKLNRYLGAANIETSGLPVQGRSGGGLFNADGELVGICFAADAELNEGLYCGTQVVHSQIDKLGLSDGQRKKSGVRSDAVLSSSTSQVAPAPQRATLPATMTVILTDSSGSTRQLTIDRPSEQLIEAMRQESQRTQQANSTSQIR